jgi:hypothetical protein
VVSPPFFFPATTSTKPPPHLSRRNPPQQHHSAQIPLAQCFLTSSPCSPARSGPAPATPRRNCPHPEPPLTRAVRARPCRRQLPPLDLQPIQVYVSFPRDPLVLVHASFACVRRPFAGNGDAPPRPPYSPVVGPVLLLPIHHTPFPCTP